MKCSIYVSALLIVILASVAAGQSRNVANAQASEREPIRNELRNAWDTWRAWTHFRGLQQASATQRPLKEFLAYRALDEATMPDVWLGFAETERKRLQEYSLRFSVSPKLAQEFAEFYRTNTFSDEDFNEAVSGYEKVLFERSLELLKDFLLKHPESIFAPEVNFRIACLLRENHTSLPHDTSASKEYFERAIEGYGDKYNDHAAHARIQVANWTEPLPGLLSYYEWAMNFVKNGKVADLHSTKHFVSFIERRGARFSNEEFDNILKGAKKNIRRSLEHSTVPTILRRATPSELEQILQKYPNTFLAERASEIK